jgi:hypothetical protein
VRIEDGTFSVAAYTAFLEEVGEGATAFKERQSEAVVGATAGY